MHRNPSSADPRATAQQGILCAKCEHLNTAGRDTCERCGAHLFVACPNCGRRNRRVAARCADCGARLHRSARRRWGRWLSARRFRIHPAHIGLAIIMAYVVYRLIVKLAEYSPPPPL